MTGTPPARAWWFLLIIVVAQFWCAQAPSSHAEAAPSLRKFFQDLVEHYSPSSLPKHEKLFKVTDQIPGAPPGYISEALPAIFVALAHHDDNVKLDAALTLVAIMQRPDSAELLRGYIGAIGHLLDLADPRLQATPLLILPNLRPTPPPEVFPLLLAFLRRTDRDPKTQAGAMGYLLGRAPEKPEAVAAALEFWSRPLDKDTRMGALNALGNSRSKDPHIINLVISSLADRDFNVRWTAFQALTRMGPVALQQARSAMQKVAADFLALLRQNDGDVNMQVSAVQDLLQYAPDDPQVVDAIQEFFSRPLDMAPRTSLQNALRIPHLKNVRLIDLVIASLNDPYAEVRSNAAYVLIAMGPQALVRAQPALERLAGDPDQPAEVKGAAGKALEEIRRTQ